VAPGSLMMTSQKNRIYPMSWKPQVQTDDTGKWYGNSLSFVTRQEALDNAEALMMRWWAVREYRAVEVEEPATHSFVGGELRNLER
jgi:hypothetical protein